MNILVAEDNEVQAVLLEATLTQAGFQVTCVRDGAEALERVRTGEFRLVVTDWEMPRMTGPELCRAIRAEDLPGYVYIILVTSRDTAQERVQGLASGADDFVAKPFNPAELIERLHTAERILSL